MLCVHFDSKLDAQTVATLQYYKALLHPLFVARNVWVVFTNTSSDTYSRHHEEEGEAAWKYVVERKCEEIQNMLDISGVRFSFVNSRPRLKNLEHLLNVGISEYKPGLLMESALLRHNMLHWVVELPPVSMEHHKFKLPPCVETKREFCLHYVNERIKEMVENLNNIDKELSNRYMHLPCTIFQHLYGIIQNSGGDNNAELN